MSEHLHTVAITGDEANPKIQFTCHGDRASECHSYPDCTCDYYAFGAEVDSEGHPYIVHTDCWLKSWFDSDGLDPCADSLAENELKPGMSGPIDVNFCDDYIEWEFINV